MADYGCYPLWWASGDLVGNIDPAKLPLSQETISRLQSLQFRESPGQIYVADKPYTHAILEFANKPLLEVHVGIRVRGVSQVAHECDVCVLYQDEANNCRIKKQEPDCSRLIIAVECKHYESELNLNERSFIYWISF